MEVEAFMTAVRDPRLAELAQNPLMLTMMLSAFAAGRSLPENPGELYRNALRAMPSAPTRRPGRPRRAGAEPACGAWHTLRTRGRGEQFRIFKANADATQWDAHGIEGAMVAAPTMGRC